MVYSSCDVRTAYITSGTSGRYGIWDNCLDPPVMPTFLALKGCPVPQSHKTPNISEYFPYLFPMSRYSRVLLVCYRYRERYF